MPNAHMDNSLPEVLFKTATLKKVKVFIYTAYFITQWTTESVNCCQTVFSSLG